MNFILKSIDVNFERSAQVPTAILNSSAFNREICEERTKVSKETKADTSTG